MMIHLLSIFPDQQPYFRFVDRCQNVSFVSSYKLVHSFCYKGLHCNLGKVTCPQRVAFPFLFMIPDFTQKYFSKLQQSVLINFLLTIQKCYFNVFFLPSSHFCTPFLIKFIPICEMRIKGLYARIRDFPSISLMIFRSCYRLKIGNLGEVDLFRTFVLH